MMATLRQGVVQTVAVVFVFLWVSVRPVQPRARDISIVSSLQAAFASLGRAIKKPFLLFLPFDLRLHMTRGRRHDTVI